MDKNLTYKSYICNDRSLQFLNQFQFQLNQHHAHLSHKLLDPKASQKSYWSILKPFLNNRKITCIPTFLHQDKICNWLKSESQYFQQFLCWLMFYCKKTTVNFRWLSETHTHKKNNKKGKTGESISKINFSTDDTLKIIRNLDVNKSHEHDMISIRMIKICDTSLCRPLKLIFQSCLESGKFPIEWKKKRMWFQFTRKVRSKY